MAQYTSSYTGSEIDTLLAKANTAITSLAVPEVTGTLSAYLENPTTDGVIRAITWGNTDVSGTGLKYANCFSWATPSRRAQIIIGYNGSAIRYGDIDGWQPWKKILFLS